MAVVAPQLDIGTLSATVDANTTPYERAMLRAQGVTTAAVRNIERDTRRTSKAQQQLAGDFRTTAQAAVFLGGALKLIKLPALLSVVQPAVQGIEALGAGAIIAANSLKGLEGAAGVLAPAMVGAATAAATLKLGLSGVSEAVDAFANGDTEAIKKATQDMSAGTAGFAAQLAALKPELKALKDAASEGLIPGLSVGLMSAQRVLPTLRKELTDTGKIVGEVATKFGDYFGGSEFKQNFTKALDDAKPLLRAVGDLMLNLARSFMTVAANATPLTKAFTKWTRDLGEFIQKQTEAAAESGRMDSYFKRVVDRMKQWGRIAENLGRAIARIFRGADGESGKFLDFLEASAMKLRLMTANGSKLQRYFAEAAVPLKEMGRLLRDVFNIFTGMGSDSGGRFAGITSFIQTLRTQLLPALDRLVNAVGPGAADAFIKLGTAVANFLNVSDFNVIVSVVNAFADLANAFIAVVKAVPGLSTLVSVLALLKVAMAGLKFTGLLFSFQALVPLLQSTIAGFKGATAALAVYRGGVTATTAANYALAASQTKAAIGMAGMGRAGKAMTGLKGAATALWGSLGGLGKAAVVALPAILVTAYGAKKVDKAFDRTGSSVERASERIKGMNAALPEQNRVLGSNSEAWNELAQSIGHVYGNNKLANFQHVFEEIFSGGGFISSLFGTKNAIDAANDSLADYGNAMADMVRSGNMQGVITALERMDPLYRQYGQSAWDAMLQQEGFKDAVLATYGTLDLYKIKLIEAEAAAKRVKQATTDAKLAIFDVQDAAAAANGVWGDSTREQVNFQTAVENAVGAIKTFQDEQIKTGEYTVEAANKIQGMVTDLFNMKNMSSEARLAVYNYVKELGLIPDSTLTTIYLKAEIDPSVYEALRLAGMSDQQIMNASGDTAAYITMANSRARRQEQERIAQANAAMAAWEAENTRLEQQAAERQRRANERAARARAAADEARRQAEEAARQRAEEARRRAEERKKQMKVVTDLANYVLKSAGKVDPNELRSRITQLMDALKTLADLPGKGGEKTLKWARGLVSQYDKLLREYEKLQEKIEDAKAKVQELKDAKAEYAKEVKGIITSFGSITDVIQEKQETGDSLRAVFARRMKVVQDFIKKVKELRKRGLNEDAIREIIAQGPVAGGQYADVILGDKGAVGLINQQQKQLAELGGSFGNTMASEFYNAGIKAAEGVLKGLQSKEAQLEKAMATIANALVKGIKKALGIKSPSRVFMELAKYIPLGLSEGILKNTKISEGAATQLSEDAVEAARKAIERSQAPVDDLFQRISPEMLKYLMEYAKRKQAGSRIDGTGDGQRILPPAPVNGPVTIREVKYAPVVNGAGLTKEQILELLEKANADFVKTLLVEIGAR